MKAIYQLSFVFTLLLTVNLLSFGQVTITSADMPEPGDTIRVSELNSISIPDPSATGHDFLWDYSSLSFTSQRVLEFIHSNQTPFFYQIVFTSAVANLALPVEDISFLQFEVSDAYEYYRNTNFQFARPGYAATIMGFPVPMKYDQPEVLYKFPLSTTSAPDSSSSQFSLQYVGIGYFHHFIKRVNKIDGSGTLITPYGSFSTIRLRSDVIRADSMYLDSLQAGFPIVTTYTEYKWLSPDYPIPLLTILTDGLTYNVQYIDSVRNLIPLEVNLGSDTTICQGESITLTALVKGGQPPYTYVWNTIDTTQSITVSPEETTTYSVVVSDASQNFSSDEIEITVQICNALPENRKENLKIKPNPANGLVYIEGEQFIQPSLTICDLKGNVTNHYTYRIDSNRITIDISRLPAGAYSVTLHDNNTLKTGKLLVK